MDTYFFAGLLKPFFWLLVMIPFLALLRWGLAKYLKPRLSPRLQAILFRKVTD